MLSLTSHNTAQKPTWKVSLTRYAGYFVVYLFFFSTAIFLAQNLIMRDEACIGIENTMSIGGFEGNYFELY